MATINVRLDDNVKQEAEILFESLGMSVSGAINIFFRQAIREQAIPFQIAHRPNKRLFAAMEETEQIIKEYESGVRQPQPYKSTKVFLQDILEENDEEDDDVLH
jgi:DNA-damage-inducible protein J